MIQSAVEQWRWNANRETRVFESDTRFAEDFSFLQSLGLACAKPHDEVRITPGAPLTSVFAALFSAAAYGGAQSGGFGAGYGRLRAWRSLGALAGAAADADCDEVSRQANACRWALFVSDSHWFGSILCDLGVVGLRPDRRSAAVLAATTDS